MVSSWMGQSPSHIDAHKPAEIAVIVETVGVAKAGMSVLRTICLAVLAGIFIGFGGLLYLLVMSDPQLGFGLSRWIGGIAFSLGLILVVVGGAELFTGNNLIVMAWADRKIGTGALLRNWGVVYLGNLVGSLALAIAVIWAGTLDLGDGKMAEVAAQIAGGKLSLGPGTAFIRGVLCNALVCLSIWLCFAAREVCGKILAIVFPISAFVALGFEHSVANMFLLPLAGWSGAAEVTLSKVIGNLVPVTMGNIVGGGVCVAGFYWLIYLRNRG